MKGPSIKISKYHSIWKGDKKKKSFIQSKNLKNEK